MSYRQLSPHLGLALLFLLGVLVLPNASAATTVQIVGLTTDRMDYVNAAGFNQVIATATVTYNGNGPLDLVAFDWRLPSGTPFLTQQAIPNPVGPGAATATTTWYADREGVGFTVIASINRTVGSGVSIVSPPATFNVYNRSQYVVVTNIVVTTARVYDNGSLATARADLTYGGTASFLAGVTFDWYYPDWTPAWSSTDSSPSIVSNDTAQAFSSWTVDREGSAFHVNATYSAGTNTATNTTSFDVISRLVQTTLTGDFTSDTLLRASSGPYGICANTSVASGVTLVIEPGTIIRFCPNTGLFVNGTLTVDALPTRRVYFLPGGLPPMRKGDWRGIAFFPGASPNSILSNAVIQGITTGVTVQGTSITVVNSVLALASGPAIWLQGSSTLVGNNTISDADIGVRIDGTNGAVVDANRIQGTRVGVFAEDSNVTVSSNNVSQTELAGLQAVRTAVTVQGGAFRDPGNAGVDLSGVPWARLSGVSIAGGNDSLRATNSRGVVVDASTLAGAWFRSLFLLNVSATLVNSTLVSLGLDLQLLASTVTAVNTTFAREGIVNSVLTVRYFLHVLVESGVTASRFPGAWVNVTSDTNVLPPRRTDANGWAHWILLTDRVVDSGGIRRIENVVDVDADGFSVAQNPRSVDMSTSHVERFVALPIGPIIYPPFTVDPMLLLVLAVVLGSVLLVMPVMRRRRRAEQPAARRGALPHETVLEPGTAYLVPDEKPDRAFEILASAVAKGSKGLVITRIYPEEVRRRFRLKDVPVLWLSRGYGKDTVNPTNLGALVHEIERFVSGKEDSVVLLDGLEYLLVQNDTQKVVKFVQTLADSASVHHTKVLMPFNEKSVGESERALLTRDLQIL